MGAVDDALKAAFDEVGRHPLQGALMIDGRWDPQSLHPGQRPRRSQWKTALQAQQDAANPRLASSWRV